jgi:sacsin
MAAGAASLAPSSIAEDFGQSVDLTRRIREILANYPEGTTLLKELIQNADDAGASHVCFCLDRRRHGQDSLLFRGTSACQGPALLAYNNARFSPQDFESISKLGGSKKQREPWKTGRFG